MILIESTKDNIVWRSQINDLEKNFKWINIRLYRLRDLEYDFLISYDSLGMISPLRHSNVCPIFRVPIKDTFNTHTHILLKGRFFCGQWCAVWDMTFYENSYSEPYFCNDAYIQLSYSIRKTILLIDVQLISNKLHIVQSARSVVHCGDRNMYL